MRVLYKNALECGFEAKAAAGKGNAIYVRGARFVTVSFGTASSANLTFKVLGGIGDSAPTFAHDNAGLSATNVFKPLDFAYCNGAGTITDGDTGIVASGTDIFEIIELNFDNMDWICPVLTARSAGSATVTITIGYPAE